MEVIIRNDAQIAAQLVARIVANSVKENPRSVLGLATGRTMEAVYRALCTIAKAEKIDFSKVTSFNLDEYIGLSPENPNSYRQYMNQFLFNNININLKNTYLPNGVAKDISKECCDYEKRILDSGGIDLQLLGLGREGHIGFNEPLSALRSRTRAKALAPGTINQNRPLFKNPDEMPLRAITMGVGTILESKRCIMLVTGTEKASVLAKAVEGPITSMISATALQLHPRCQVVVDEQAASQLHNREYYRWVFENEPEWEGFR